MNSEQFYLERKKVYKNLSYWGQIIFILLSMLGYFFYRYWRITQALDKGLTIIPSIKYDLIFGYTFFSIFCVFFIILTSIFIVDELNNNLRSGALPADKKQRTKYFLVKILNMIEANFVLLLLSSIGIVLMSLLSNLIFVQSIDINEINWVQYIFMSFRFLLVLIPYMILTLLSVLLTNSAFYGGMISILFRIAIEGWLVAFQEKNSFILKIANYSPKQMQELFLGSFSKIDKVYEVLNKTDKMNIHLGEIVFIFIMSVILGGIAFVIFEWRNSRRKNK